ncbi:hypothetical protein BT69DRAFT_1322761 [Atractiella rhizophila]|nr:hypothetical protein BT69DRAFT_1322761 [Atractiella rhizophila]
MFQSDAYDVFDNEDSSVQRWAYQTAEVLSMTSTSPPSVNIEPSASMSDSDLNELVGALFRSLGTYFLVASFIPDTAWKIVLRNPLRLNLETFNSPSPLSDWSIISDTLPSPEDVGSPDSCSTLSLLPSNTSEHENGLPLPTVPNDRWRNTDQAIKLSKLRPGEIYLRVLPYSYRIGLLKRAFRNGCNFGNLLKFDDGLSHKDIDYFDFDPSKYREVIIRKNGQESICRPDSAKAFTNWIKGFVFGTDCCRHRNSVWFYREDYVRDIMEEENRERCKKDSFNRPDVIIAHLSTCAEVRREFPEVYWFCKAWIEAKRKHPLSW